MKCQAPHSWLDGQPAAVTRKVGQGSITYVGVWLDEFGMKRAVQWMLNSSGVKPDLFAVPAGVEVYRRTCGDKSTFIVENDAENAATVNLPDEMLNILTGETVHSVNLALYGVAVLEKGAASK